jgi:hypothetical protein
MVLEEFARLMERDGGPPEGLYRMAADMASSRSAFRGGAWTLRSMRSGRHFTMADIARFEESIPGAVEGPDGTPIEVRRYDVTLASGERIEMKSWTRWFPETIRSQFPNATC